MDSLKNALTKNGTTGTYKRRILKLVINNKHGNIQNQNAYIRNNFPIKQNLSDSNTI